MAHEYLVTKPSGVPPAVPTMRDPSLLVYFRGESGGLVMGGYERSPAPWGLDGIPSDFNGQLLPEDWERFEELMTNAVVRVPELEEAEVRGIRVAAVGGEGAEETALREQIAASPALRGRVRRVGRVPEADLAGLLELPEPRPFELAPCPSLDQVWRFDAHDLHVEDQLVGELAPPDEARAGTNALRVAGFERNDADHSLPPFGPAIGVNQRVPYFLDRRP